MREDRIVDAEHTAGDLLYERVLPFYDSLGIPVRTVLTDHGREFCGRPERHPYELLLAIQGIEHRHTKVRSPRTNGLVERMNRTLLDECFRVKGRENFYLSIAEIQRDLDKFMTFHNLEAQPLGPSIQWLNAGAGTTRGARPPVLPNLRFEPIDEPSVESVQPYIEEIEREPETA